MLTAGIVSSFFVLPMTIWIAIQVGYTLLGVRYPFYFKRLSKNKRKGHILHVVSLLVGISTALVPSLLTLGLGGYSPVDTRFPPIVCFARNRDIAAYMLLIPVGVVMAIVLTELTLILHYLLRYLK